VPTEYFAPLLRGFGLGASLIIAIGAQNAFVLRMGLRRQYVFAVALLSTLCDALLISLGAAGFGSIVSAFPLFATLAAWGGAIFLLFYGFRSFRSALKPSSLDVAAGGETEGPKSLGQALLMTAAFSLLNPHVWLDTVVLLGGIGGQYAAVRRAFFAAGAMLASLLWFFALAYGAARLTPLFRKPATWRVLDALIGCVMWAIAGSLVWSVAGPRAR